MGRRELSAADIYRKFAAQLDEDGFRLYRAAQRLTGFQPYDAFPMKITGARLRHRTDMPFCAIWKQRISMPSHGRSSPEPPMNEPFSARWTPPRRNTARFVKRSARTH